MQNNLGLKSFFKSHIETIILVTLLLIFLGYSLFIAFNLKPGIIPDENAHFIFSKHHATTPGIPQDTYETYSLGWYINQNPFLYHWLNGRIINLIRIIQPDANDWQLLVTLRFLNTFFSLGTVIFCYFLASELFKNTWWRLLPVFLLTNTLMFVFLSAGVNYDNLANLFSIVGLYFLIRVLNGKSYLSNSILWIIFITSGSLVKFTILPLGFAMVVVWAIYSIKTKPRILIPENLNAKTISLLILLLLLVYGNLSIYGVNLFRYQSLTPPCREILLESQCQISPYERRHQEMALENKMTIRESVEMGYPNPIMYVGNTWIRVMILRTFGIAGHLSYTPEHLVNYYRVMIYGLIIIMLININKYTFKVYALIGIVIFYSAILLYQNYNSELVYGFLHIAFQGRYIFPVIGAIYSIIPAVILATKNKYLQIGMVVFLVILFIAGGPVILHLNYNHQFANWFI